MFRNNPILKSLTLALLLQTKLLAQPSFAADLKKFPGEVPCPAVVADLVTGKFTPSVNKYVCFNRANHAKAAGFLSEQLYANQLVFSGRGNKTTQLFYIDRPSIVTYSCTGRNYFYATIHNSGGRLAEVLSGSTCPYTYSTTFGGDGDVGSFYINTNGKGPWVITIVPRY